MTKWSRIAVALSAGILVTAWITFSYGIWSPMIQLSRCTALSTDTVCRVNAALFFAFYALWFLTIPAVLLVSTAAIWGILGAKAPGQAIRPAGVTLGVILLAGLVATRLVGFWMDVGIHESALIRRTTDQTLRSVVLPPALIVVATLAAIGLWRLRERGRILALALLALTLVIAAPTWIFADPAVLSRPLLAGMAVLVYFAQLALFVYLLMPSTRALFRHGAS